MATFLHETFTDFVNTDLSTHVGEVGATWTSVTGSLGALSIAGNSKCADNGAGTQEIAKASGTPASANYSVTAVMFYASLASDTTQNGIVARLVDNNNYYYASYYFGDAKWYLQKKVSGSVTTLGTPFSQALTVGNSYTLMLTCNGSSLALNVDGVDRVTATDGDLTATGKAGLFTGAPAGHGLQFDSIDAADLAGGGATAVTFSGPSSGITTAASSNYTVGVDATPITGTLVVTPHTDVTSGGSFTPTTVSLTTGSPTATFTFTPAKSGVHHVSVTNNGGLTNPAALTYTASPVVTGVLVTSPTDATPRANLSGLKYAWFDATSPANFVAPVSKGSTVTTDGSGNFTLSIVGSALTNGQTGWLVITNSDGTATQAPAGKTGGGPMVVT